MALTDIQRMRKILRDEEAGLSMFSDDDLQFYIDENDGDINKAIYQCLIIKSENGSISITGLSMAETSSYYKRLASTYRPNNSGILGGN
jgi:hypothetical protein